MPPSSGSNKAPSKKKASTAKSKDATLDFEQALSQLEELVNKMEGGDLSLEDSLAAFENGVKLTREAQARLNSAEQRVKVLMEEQGQLVETDFEDQD